jgi:hypothetical protein
MPPARGPSTMADPADRDVTMALFGHNLDERSSSAPSRAGLLVVEVDGAIGGAT